MIFGFTGLEWLVIIFLLLPAALGILWVVIVLVTAPFRAAALVRAERKDRGISGRL